MPLLALALALGGIAPAHAADGTVSGTVTYSGAAPDFPEVVAYRWVEDYPDEGYWEWWDSADVYDGDYSLTLPADTYRICFVDWDEDYARTCHGGGSFPEDGTDVVVPSGGTVDVDLAPRQNATISGRVTDTEGNPLGYMSVDAHDSAVADEGMAYEASGFTEEDGTYTIKVPAGSYQLWAYGDYEHLPEWYDDQTTRQAATVTTVASGQTLNGVDFALAKAASIAGTVQFPGSADFDYGREVRVVDSITGDLAGQGWVDESTGAYEVLGLFPGSYRVEFGRASGTSLAAAEFYDDQAEGSGPGGATVVQLAGAQAVTGVDATLATGGEITGTLVDEEGNPLENCRVQAFRADGSLATRTDDTAADGSFSVTGLTTGDYQLRVADWASLTDCEDGDRFFTTGSGWLSEAEGDAVSVSTTIGETVTLADDLVYAPQGSTPPKPEPEPVANVTAPSIDGTAKVGEPVTADPGSWDPADVDLTFQWLLDGDPVDGATARTYTPRPADVRGALAVEVTASSPERGSATATSSTTTVAKGTITARKPRVRGKTKVRRKLTARLGAISPDSVKVRYQWLRNGRKIRRAKQRTYRLVRKDRGKRIQVRVAYRAPGYQGLVLKSARTRRIRR